MESRHMAEIAAQSRLRFRAKGQPMRTEWQTWIVALCIVIASGIGVPNAAQTQPAAFIGPGVFRLEPESVSRVSGTFGEIETAVSADGTNVVVAVNNILGNPPFGGDTVFHSANLGNFQPSRLAPELRNRRDPTVVRSGSGAFYYAALSGGNANHGAVLGQSVDGGQSFSFVNDIAARCIADNPGATTCNSDQPHMAADPRPNSGSASDQLYMVWRDTDQNGAGAAAGPELQMIQCSPDGGATWSVPQVVGVGILSRVAAGSDGRVYVVWTDGRNGNDRQIFIQRFSACRDGFVRAFGSAGGLAPPRSKVVSFDNVVCPVPGLDRCNDGNILSSPTVSVDARDPDRVFVTYAHRVGDDNEEIRTIVSLDGGATFPVGPIRISSAVPSRKFMPWSCGGDGRIFVGWYDRRAASAHANDRTQYFARALALNPAGPTAALQPRLSTEVDLTSGTPDPQCASGFPHAPRNSADSEQCPAPVPAAGVCAPIGVACDTTPGTAGCACSRPGQCGAGLTCSAGRCIDNRRLVGGSAPRCVFSQPSCQASETCQIGRGAPKYGDYNGLACTGASTFMAWASGTPPAGAVGAGFGVFYRRINSVFVPATVARICGRGADRCGTAENISRGVLELECRKAGCRLVAPVPEICKRAVDCPGCVSGRCAPDLKFHIAGLSDAWAVELVNDSGRRLARTKSIGSEVVEVTIPSRARKRMPEGHLVFTLTDRGQAHRKYHLKIDIPPRSR